VDGKGQRDSRDHAHYYHIWYHRHLLVNFLVALVYVIIHSFLLFVHVVTLFVAVNSTDQVRHTSIKTQTTFRLILDPVAPRLFYFPWYYSPSLLTNFRFSYLIAITRHC